MRILTEEQKEKKKLSRRAYYLAHREQEIATAQKWNTSNREICLERRRANHKANKDKEREYNREKIKTDPKYRMLIYACKRVNRALRDTGNKRLFSNAELLGCTWEELVKHLEAQFKSGMTWENHGNNGWHLDHIKPISLFDLSKPEQQKICFHYTNLQPLWAHENRVKGGRYGE